MLFIEMKITIARVESTKHYPYSKKCEKFRLLMPAEGFCMMLFVVIAAAHIALIYDYVHCGSCSLLLLQAD